MSWKFRFSRKDFLICTFESSQKRSRTGISVCPCSRVDSLLAGFTLAVHSVETLFACTHCVLLVCTCEHCTMTPIIYKVRYERRFITLPGVKPTFLCLPFVLATCFTGKTPIVRAGVLVLVVTPLTATNSVLVAYTFRDLFSIC